MAQQKDTFRLLVYSRALRSTALIYMTLAFSLYLTALGVSVVDIGIVSALTMLFMVFLVMALGAVGDRKGYKYELVISEAFTLAGSLLVAASPSAVLVVMGMIIAGLSSGAGGLRGSFSPGLNAIIASNYRDQADRVKRFSVLTSVASIFSIFGSVMFGSVSLLAGHVGLAMAYRYMFLASAAMVACSLGCLLLIRERKRPVKTTRIMKRSSFMYIARVILANSIGGIGIGLAMPLLPLWFALVYGASPLQIGVVFGVSYAITALGAYMSSRMSRGTDVLDVAAATRSLNGVFLIVMAFSPLFLISGMLYILRSFFVGLGAPSRTAINVKGVHDEDYGTATSVQGVAVRASQLSSGISGYLMDYALPLPIFVGGLFQLASGAAYKLLLGRKGETEAERHSRA